MSGLAGKDHKPWLVGMTQFGPGSGLNRPTVGLNNAFSVHFSKLADENFEIISRDVLDKCSDVIFFHLS